MEKTTTLVLSTLLMVFTTQMSTTPVDLRSDMTNFVTIEGNDAELTWKIGGPDDATTQRIGTIDIEEVELIKRDEIAAAIEESDTPLPFLPEPEITLPASQETAKLLYTVNHSVLNPTDTEHVVGTEACLCGKSISKIVGGEDARINDLPWTALLYKRGFFGGRSPYCGATLINNLYVLTASHCVDGMSVRSIDVVLKEENLSTTQESKSFTFTVSKIIMHPYYSRKNIDNDIALLKLSSPVELSANGPFVPACVPNGDGQSFEGQNATAAGWGATRQGGSVSKVLKRVDVPIISNEKCNMTKYQGKITENMLCAGDVEKGGKDSCQGDSGGPLVVATNNRKIVVGVVSWGYGCAKSNSPGVYTRVNRYTNWIVSETSDATWCNE